MTSSEEWILEYLEYNEKPCEVGAKLEEALLELDRIKGELHELRARKL